MKPKSKKEAKKLEEYQLYKPFKLKGKFKKKIKRQLSKIRRRDVRRILNIYWNYSTSSNIWI